MNDLNKITHTKVGDNIHYYVNGDEGRGVVVKNEQRICFSFERKWTN